MNLFKPEGKVFEVLDLVKKLVIVNLLFLIGCIPIVTIGTSFTALYAAVFKIRKKKDGYVRHDFWQAFKMNLKQSAGLTICFLLAGAVFGINRVLLFNFNIDPIGILKGTNIIGILLLFMIFTYIWPTLAKFDNKNKIILQSAFYLSIRHFNPAIYFISALPLLIFLFIDNATIFRIFPIMLIIGFSAGGYFSSSFFERIFAKYNTSEAEEQSKSQVIKE